MPKDKEITKKESRPFTGAWIETRPCIYSQTNSGCRPFTGAWIETHLPCRPPASDQVAPSRGRGLKPFFYGFIPACAGRPFTGAWIETASALRTSSRSVVAPSRGRGLKLVYGQLDSSPPGRPFTGAWIETCRPISISVTKSSPLHGGVD